MATPSSLRNGEMLTSHTPSNRPGWAALPLLGIKGQFLVPGPH